ncbi:hypothetical protein ACUXIJ_000690 [Staphylococcus haemolyticus]
MNCPTFINERIIDRVNSNMLFKYGGNVLKRPYI